MKENGVFIAHCPESNMNLSSGVAPVRTFLKEGLHVGIGSDVAGGSTEICSKQWHLQSRPPSCAGGCRMTV